MLIKKKKFKPTKRILIDEFGWFNFFYKNFTYYRKFLFMKKKKISTTNKNLCTVSVPTIGILKCVNLECTIIENKYIPIKIIIIITI